MNDITIRPVGAVVYWGCSTTDREKLSEKAERCGFGDLVPNKRTPESALFNALKDGVPDAGVTRDYLIQPLKSRNQKGFEVVEVHKGTERNSYSALFSARVHSDTVKFSEGLWDYATIDGNTVQDLYDQYRRTLTGAAVGSFLVSVCQRLRGTSLRPSGGIYWIPEDSLDRWNDVTDAVESSACDYGKSEVFRLRTLLDAQSASAVISAITKEVTDQSDEILEGIGELGEKALRTREERSRELKKKVEHYEGMLGESLGKLKTVCDIATKSAAHAALAQL